MRRASWESRALAGGSVLLGCLLGLGAARADTRPSYVGAGACSASNCHGSVVPRRDSKLSLQNEYITWYKQDRHAKAYSALSEERALRIARRLGMVSGGEASSWLDGAAHPERCLDCHALDVPAAERGPRFDVRDGVSCQACHGPAGGWIDRHTEAGWTPERSIALGMVDTRDPARAAEICLSCHLGSATQRVDHELIAAGHPALAFELDTFAASLPAHWTEHEGNGGWFRAGPWLVGQAVALREAARHLPRQVRGAGWPDFAAYDCSACHHELRPESGWRQDRGGVPGRPPWEESRYAVLSDLARTVAPDLAGPLDAAVGRLDRLTREGRDGPELGGAAEALVTVAEQLVVRARRTELDGQGVARVMRAVVSDAHRLAYAGFGTAQQLAWGLDSLAVARESLSGAPPPATRAVAGDDALRAAIGRLFDQLTDRARYDPARFARDVRDVAGKLP